MVMLHCILFWVMPHPDMPATRLLTYAEMTAKLATRSFQSQHRDVWRYRTIPPPLTFPYTPAPSGTWPVSQAKFIKLEIDGRQETASVDRPLRWSVDGLRLPDRVPASDDSADGSRRP